MEAAYASLRKYDFPASVTEALRHVHIQCQNFSKTGVPSPQELTQLLDFIDDFIFSHPRCGKQQKKTRRFTSVQQLQLIQILSEYFSSDADFSLLCSVFMIIFMVKGRDVEFKVQTLSRLLCVSLGTAQLAVLNCTGLWMAQQSPASEHCLSVARALLSDCLVLLPDTHLSLAYLPAKSPLLAANLLVAFGQLYSALGSLTVGRTSTPPPLLSEAIADSAGKAAESGFCPPPIQVVRLAAAWLKDNPELCGGQGSTPHQGSLPITGVTPAAGLISWTVLEPLFCQEEEDREAYSALHLILLQSLQEPTCRSSIPSQQLGQLTETLLSVFNSHTFPEHKLNACMDRYGQMMQAAIASRTPIERDLVTLINQLPHNRLLHIVLASRPS